MLTRTRICIGKDQGREVGGRRKQFARANGYGTMRRERALPFLLFLFSLSLSRSLSLSVLHLFRACWKNSRNEWAACTRVYACEPSIARSFLGQGSQVFFRISGKDNEGPRMCLQPPSSNLSYDFSSLSTLFTRLTEIYDGVRSISLSAASFSRIWLAWPMPRACVCVRLAHLLRLINSR